MRVFKDIFKVIASNLTTILSGVVVSFLLPKIISVSDYGFYKIFTLYFNYLGVLSLGIIDGIVLRFGGKNYEELDRRRFRSYFAWYSILHIVLTIAIVLISFFVNALDYKFLILILGANLIPANITGYFQQISQITQRFKEYSTRKILQSACNILLILLLFFLYGKNFTAVTYKLYLICLLAVNLALVMWYIWTYRDIIIGKRDPLSSTLKDVLSLSKLGFPLLLANMCSTLLLSLDRQFVSMLFSTEEYATYAFAYSILSLVTVATSSISIVLYPIFKRVDKSLLKDNYKNVNSILLVFVFFVMAVYFPMGYFVVWFLPKYTYSLSIFRIILPGLAISASITVVMHNYYKVLDLSTDFFKKSIVALAVSLVFNIVAFLLFGTRESISIASILALLVWYFYCRNGLRNVCRGTQKDTAYMLLMCLAFYGCTAIQRFWLSGVLYACAYILISASLFGRDWRLLKSIIFHRL